MATKTVQDLVIQGGGEAVAPPHEYIHTNEEASLLRNTCVELMDVSIIDLGLLGQLTSYSTSVEELNKLRSALTTQGCFQVVNHGMSPEFLDKVYEVTKQFFAMPMEEKRRSMRPVDEFDGYGNDMVVSDQQILDWSDRLYLTVHPPHKCKLNIWPQNPTSFRGTLEEYTRKLQVIAEAVLKGMARSLHLEEDCLLDKYGEHRQMDARFNYYPPCSRPDRVHGFKPHSDSSMITIILQDKEVEGLQFMKDDGQWLRAPVSPEALLILVGDQIEILSNGVFKSPVHKAVINEEKERVSLAVFCFPDSDTEFGPFESLVSETRPRLYKSLKNYMDLFFEYYQKGRRTIEAALI